MCIIAICKSRKLTPKEAASCWASNRDGAGFAYRDPETGLNHLEKGFMSLVDFKQAYEQVPTLPHVVHFRIGTHGAHSPGLTHPFICSEDSPTYLLHDGPEALLFHNGVACGHMRLADQLGLKTDQVTWSDTRVVACAVHKHGQDFLCTAGGKYVLLDGDGRIWMYGSFEEEDGVLFSNGSYKLWTTYVSTHPPYKVLESGTWTKYVWSNKLERYVPEDTAGSDTHKPDDDKWIPMIDCRAYWQCSYHIRSVCRADCKGGYVGAKTNDKVGTPKEGGLTVVTTRSGTVRVHGASSADEGGPSEQWSAIRDCPTKLWNKCPVRKRTECRADCTKYESREN